MGLEADEDPFGSDGRQFEEEEESVGDEDW
jgi:hypothetical protein